MRQGKEYEKLRDDCIRAYKEVYKDSIAFDMNECTKEERAVLLEDPVYITKTRALKAKLYAKNLSIYQAILDGAYSDDEHSLTPSDVMKALDARNKILFNDLNIEADDTNRLNIIVTYLSKEDIESLDIVKIKQDGAAFADITDGLRMVEAEELPSSGDETIYE